MASGSPGTCKGAISLASGRLSNFTFPHVLTGAANIIIYRIRNKVIMEHNNYKYHTAILV